MGCQSRRLPFVDNPFRLEYCRAWADLHRYDPAVCGCQTYFVINALISTYKNARLTMYIFHALFFVGVAQATW